MHLLNGLARSAHGNYVATVDSRLALMEDRVRARLIALVTLVVGLSVAPAMAAPLLSFSPSTTTVNAGGTFSLNVEISGLTGTTTCANEPIDCLNLWGYQFDINYNPLYLQVVQQGGAAVTEGPFLGSGGGTTNFVAGTIDPTGSIVNTLNLLTSIDPGVTGGGVLATVMFQALLAGANTTSSITFSNIFLVNYNEALLSPDVNAASVTINPVSAEVPEPATLLLLGTGLTLAARRRLRRSRKTL